MNILPFVIGKLLRLLLSEIPFKNAQQPFYYFMVKRAKMWVRHQHFLKTMKIPMKSGCGSHAMYYVFDWKWKMYGYVKSENWEALALWFQINLLLKKIIEDWEELRQASKTIWAFDFDERGIMAKQVIVFCCAVTYHYQPNAVGMLLLLGCLPSFLLCITAATL